MEESQKELQRLQDDNARLAQARSRLLEAPSKASERLAEMERELPELMVAVALEETPTDTLTTFKTELQNLREIAREPVREAIKIIEARQKLVLGEMAGIRHRQLLAGDKAKYQAAREAITAKGGFTVFEWEEVESLAYACGDGADYRRFKHAIDDYIYRRGLPGQTAGFPPFEYVPEGLAA